MFCMTWNMGGANQKAFGVYAEQSLPEIDEYDLVALCF